MRSWVRSLSSLYLRFKMLNSHSLGPHLLRGSLGSQVRVSVRIMFTWLNSPFPNRLNSLISKTDVLAVLFFVKSFITLKKKDGAHGLRFVMLVTTKSARLWQKSSTNQRFIIAIHCFLYILYSPMVKILLSGKGDITSIPLILDAGSVRKFILI